MGRRNRFNRYPQGPDPIARNIRAARRQATAKLYFWRAMMYLGLAVLILLTACVCAWSLATRARFNTPTFTQGEEQA